MIKALLICGLVAGLCAGLLATGFAQFVGEPAIDDAIAYEQTRSAASPEEPALVSRDIQSSFGLLTAAVVYGVAVGGLFALVFALVYGRVAPGASPARTALWLAAAAFVVVFLVPFVKYPAQPPGGAVDAGAASRTTLYFAIVSISLLAAVAGVRVRRFAVERAAAGVATAAGVAVYAIVVIAAGVALPSVSDVRDGFPAATLWEFREASVATQLILWATIGTVFAAAAQRVMHGFPMLPRRHELSRMGTRR